MNTILLTLATVVAIALAGLAYIRLAPTDPLAWHVDPVAAADPGRTGVRLVPPDSPEFPVAPRLLIAEFDEVASSAPRTKRIAGSLGDGHVTYETRTRWIGFPDYLSVRVLPTQTGATLAILSRQRFGSSDLGVNKARLDNWLSQLDANSSNS